VICQAQSLKLTKTKCTARAGAATGGGTLPQPETRNIIAKAIESTEFAHSSRMP
jgi:hypothetical protein